MTSPEQQQPALETHSSEEIMDRIIRSALNAVILLKYMIAELFPFGPDEARGREGSLAVENSMYVIEKITNWIKSW
jgi:hypothetical protein